MALVAQCPGEHRWNPLCLPGTEEGGDQTETGTIRPFILLLLQVYRHEEVCSILSWCCATVVSPVHVCRVNLQIEQEKLASLKKLDDDKKEKENKERERAQSKSPRR